MCILFHVTFDICAYPQCVLCSVFRVPSVIMCSSALILQSLTVTAVQFEIRYQFNTRALRAQCQYMCSTRCRTHGCMCSYGVHVLYTCIHSVCPYSDTYWGSERQRISRAGVREYPPTSRHRNGFLSSKNLLPKGGCALVILIAATIVAAIINSGDL